MKAYINYVDELINFPIGKKASFQFNSCLVISCKKLYIYKARDFFLYIS